MQMQFDASPIIRPMRGSVWRYFLMCLLLVAMPLQGFAAVSMLVCGANHERLYSSAAQGSASTSHAQHMHCSDPSDDHESSAAAASTDPLPVPQAAASALSHDTGSQFKCNTCGPCCIGAVLTTDLTIGPVPMPSSADFPDIPTPHPSPAPRGLDRPPQTILA